MSEHGHEWKGYVSKPFVGVTSMATYLCTHPSCREELSIEEVQRRLNATDRLSAEIDFRIVAEQEALAEDDPKGNCAANHRGAIRTLTGLKEAYADILEEKDETE